MLDFIKVILASELFIALCKAGVITILLKKMVAWWSDKSGRLFKKTSLAYRNVKGKVKDLQVSFYASRATITELSNGGVYLSTRPKYRITMTVEERAEGLDSILPYYQERPATGPIMGLLLSLDEQKSMYIADIDEEPDPARKELLQENGARCIWMYMMHRTGNIPIGVLALSFPKPNMLDDLDRRGLLQKAKAIERLMQAN